MMTFTAPDGTILESLPYPQEVTYTCQSNLSGGVYEHIEGTSNVDRPNGLQIIKVTRTVSNNGSVQINIVEYSESEIVDYLNANQNNQ
jgi:hypothetical protein